MRKRIIAMRKSTRVFGLVLGTVLAIGVFVPIAMALVIHSDNVLITGATTIGQTSGGTHNGNWVFSPNDQFPILAVRSGFTQLWRFSGNANAASGTIGTIDLLKTGGVFRIRDAVGGAIMSIDEDGFVGIGIVSPTKLFEVGGTASVQILEITGGSDLAEGFKVDGLGHEVRPGTVVSIHPERPGEMMVSTKAYETTVAGIVSGAGGLEVGLQLGDIEAVESGEFHPVALTGRVYVWADTSHGAIQPGDMLTTSGANPGFAAKVADFQRAHGTVIGKAMTPLQGEEGLVLVLVTLQ